MGKFKGMLCIVLATAMFFHAPPSMGSMAEPIQAEAASAVQLNKTKLIMDKGGTYQLKLSGFKKKVTWKSSNKRVATVSSSGKVTAKKAGKAVITAKAGKNSYRCSVTVENPKISKKNATVYVGKTITLKMNNTVRKAVWSSANKSVATVGSKGVVKGKQAGVATITAKVGNKKYTCKVTVKKQTSTADKEKAAVLKRINQERKAKGLSSLQMDVTLNAAADVRAKELVEYFSHTRPNGSSCFSILDTGKYQVSYIMAGENIAAGYSSADAVMTGWMNSEGHRANILNSGYDKVGIGYYYNSSEPYQYYWVQIFIRSN